jgi:hypothetical protein
VIGYAIEYRPWHLAVDVGALVAQSILEPAVHRGIDQNWLLNVSWRP